MQHRDYIILQKIIAELRIGMELLGKSTLDEFMENELLKRALEMTTINVGELIKNVTADLKKMYPEIPWKAIAGMRDITAHKYQTLRMEDVYNTVKLEFPALKEQLENIIEQKE